MKSEIVAIVDVITSPSPVKVTSPVPSNLKSSPIIEPFDVEIRYGDVTIESHEGESSIVASSRELPENTSEPDQTSLPIEEAGLTEIETGIIDSPLLWPSSPEIFTMVSESQVEPDTLPNIPVIGFRARTPVVSVSKISPKDCPTFEVII